MIVESDTRNLLGKEERGDLTYLASFLAALFAGKQVARSFPSCEHYSHKLENSRVILAPKRVFGKSAI